MKSTTAQELDRWRDEIVHNLKSYGIPPYMHEGVTEYLLHGRRIGHFLTAVFSNDLYEAAGRADDANSDRLRSWAGFVKFGAPIGSFGSLANVEQWQSDGGVAGRLAKEAEASHATN